MTFQINCKRNIFKQTNHQRVSDRKFRTNWFCWNIRKIKRLKKNQLLIFFALYYMD